MLANIAAMSRVLDAETVVVGMRPAVAITLVELGLSLRASGPRSTSSRAWQLLAQASMANGGRTMADVDGAEDLPIGQSDDVVRVRQAVRDAASSSVLASSTRPKSSRRRASSHATR